MTDTVKAHVNLTDNSGFGVVGFHTYLHIPMHVHIGRVGRWLDVWGWKSQQMVCYDIRGQVIAIASRKQEPDSYKHDYIDISIVAMDDPISIHNHIHSPKCYENGWASG